MKPIELRVGGSVEPPNIDISVVSFYICVYIVVFLHTLFSLCLTVYIRMINTVLKQSWGAVSLNTWMILMAFYHWGIIPWLSSCRK